MWSMWSVKRFYGLFVDPWNKGNIYIGPEKADQVHTHIQVHKN